MNLADATSDLITLRDDFPGLVDHWRINVHRGRGLDVQGPGLDVDNPTALEVDAITFIGVDGYLGDMTRPLKAMMPEYRHIELKVWHAVCDRFDIDPILPESVTRADMVALATERRDLMPQAPGEWECLKGIPEMPERITPMSAQEASMKFFSRLMELMQGDHRRRMSA